MVQLSHLYTTAGNTIALTIQTSVGKVMSLLFNTLSRLVIASLLRSKHLLISCLHSPSRVILESKKIKSVTASTFSPSAMKLMGPDSMILVFLLLSFNQLFHSPLSLSSKGSLVHINNIKMVKQLNLWGMTRLKINKLANKLIGKFFNRFFWAQNFGLPNFSGLFPLWKSFHQQLPNDHYPSHVFHK